MSNDVETAGLRRWLTTRWRLAYFASAIGILVYVARAVAQLVLVEAERPLQDFPAFYDAAAALNHGGDLYAAFLGSCPGRHWCLGGYIYPPLLAELLRPIALLPEPTAARLWLVLSHALLVASAVIAYRAVRQWLPRGAAPLLLAASVLFLPLYQSLHAAQVGALMLFGLVVSAWLFVRGRDAETGASLAGSALLRVTPVAMAPMLLRTRGDIRRPWGLVWMGVVGLLGLGLLYLLTPFTIEYFTEVLPRLSSGTGVMSNVSLPGLAERLQLTLLHREILAPGTIGIATTALGVAVTWLASLRLNTARERAAVFAAFVAVLPVVSSLTWNYHLVTELLVYALLAPSLAVGSRAWWLAVIAYPLLWIYGDGLILSLGLVPGSEGYSPGVLLLSGLNTAGATCLWVATIAVLRGYHRAPRPAPAPI